MSMRRIGSRRTAGPGRHLLSAVRAIAATRYSRAVQILVVATALATAGVAVPAAAAVTTHQARAASSAAHSHPRRAARVAGVLPRVASHPVRRACPQPTRARVAGCLALVRTDVRPHRGLFRRGVTVQAAPSGYGPSDLQSAYDLPSSTAGNGATVAVVDAYNDPDAAADLATYRAQYGLPACTAASGCFRVVNQKGQASPLPADAGTTGWDEEESLDVDMVSAVCPHCKIILVEAKGPSIANLGTAVDAAVALGADYVSNSYGAIDQAAETRWDKYYDHPGAVITASAGDGGYGVNYPSASQYVTAVGGTTLVQDSSVARGWAEAVWGSASGGEGTGSGCSGFEPQPSWQSGVTRGCARRATTDVSADANPNTGVAFYDSYSGGGWGVVGGTSVASPVIASSYALAGLPGAGTYPASYLYAHYSTDPSVFNDVTSGANGTCTPAVLCTAGPGWDGPTGLGTPHGVTGFGYAKTGSITGTVTDGPAGHPVAGAAVSVPGLSVTTGSGGSYTLSGIPAGSVKVRVSAYGYRGSSATVTVTAGKATTKSFALADSLHVTVSGTVTAGTGTAWPLSAQVTWTQGSHSGLVDTSPATGQYSVSLLEHASYKLNLTPFDHGYTAPAAKTVTVGTGNVTQDFTAAVNLTACTALGYHPVLTGRTQPFDGTSAPAGWTVTNTNLHITGYTNTPGWVFNDPGHRGNHTGGAGNFAIVDSAYDGPSHYQDTQLTSPPVSMTGDKTPAVVFATDYQPAANSTATVAVSTNGGKTWATAWTSRGFPGVPGPATIAVPLPTAAGKPGVRVRFGYTGQSSQYWEIDNVFLGNRVCAQQAGALVTGRVTSTSGSPINGATITSASHPTQTTVTSGGGLYTLFSTGTGSQKFTATATGYTASTQTATLATGHVTTRNFTLTVGS
jgi:carboxypeptidase family protein